MKTYKVKGTIKDLTVHTDFTSFSDPKMEMPPMNI
jgi:hypothetical protein